MNTPATVFFCVGLWRSLLCCSVANLVLFCGPLRGATGPISAPVATFVYCFAPAVRAAVPAFSAFTSVNCVGALL
jgi:hypothetical protein